MYPFKTNKKPIKFYEKDIERSFIRDGFGIKGSAESVNTESQLQRSELTTYKMPQQLGTLPLPTTHGRGISGTVLSQESTREKKSCQPSSTNFYNRSFTIFNQIPDISKHVQKGVDFRQGISTRSLNKTKYSK